MIWTSGGGGGAGFFLQPFANKIKKPNAQIKQAQGGNEYRISHLMEIDRITQGVYLAPNQLNVAHRTGGTYPEIT